MSDLLGSLVWRSKKRIILFIGSRSLHYESQLLMTTNPLVSFLEAKMRRKKRGGWCRQYWCGDNEKEANRGGEVKASVTHEMPHQFND
jgi:hypothetical protein